MVRESETTALLLVDLQEGYFNVPGLQRERARLVDAARRLAEAADGAGALVVEARTAHEHDPDTWALNMREDGQPFMLRGSPETAPLAELESLARLRHHVVVEKTRDSAFHRTNLLELLERHGVERLVLAGISTESCISATAADAYAHDLRVVLAADATAAGDPDQHVAMLQHLGQLYRQPAIGVDDVRFAPTALRAGG